MSGPGTRRPVGRLIAVLITITALCLGVIIRNQADTRQVPVTTPAGNETGKQTRPANQASKRGNQ